MVAFSDSSRDPAVAGFLHSPEIANGTSFVLTHGAGSNCQAPLLVALAESLAAAGFTVLRCNLPFRQNRPSGPPHPAGGARDRLGMRHAVDAMRRLTPAKVFLGGHSYGGRQGSMLAAEDPELVEGLLLLSYPLHPPEKPAQLRTQHFSALRTPSMFVSGDSDPFGSVAEMTAAIALIPAWTELLTVENAGHDLGFKGKAKKTELPASIVNEMRKMAGM